MPPTTAYIADWVLPVCQPPIADAAVLVDPQGKILFVGPRAELPTGIAHEQEFADSVIAPGMINAHTHLEFSDLEKPLGHAGIEFTQWIQAVIHHRMQTSHSPEQSIAAKAAAVAQGLRQSSQHGIAAIGEIATAPLLIDHYAPIAYTEIDYTQPVHLTVFFEQLGSDEAVFDAKLAEVNSFFSSAAQKSIADFMPAISPHAPYSVGSGLLSRLLNTSKSNRCPVAMHVAETLAEREFVEQKTGPFAEMLQSLNVWRPEAYQQHSIAAILQSLAICDRSLVVHGNYLTPDELDLIALHRQTMSVVFCPRTHAYFGHSPYPLEDMLERGINVAVGTDSLASNPDLDIVAELKAIARLYPEVSRESIVEMGTANGAAALGLPAGFGSLAVGQKMRLSVIENTSNSASPYGWLE